MQGERIWIVGASSGIGRALALRLAAEGASLVLSARNEQALQELVAELRGAHEIVPLDVAELDSIHSAMSRVFASGKRVDRIIYLAARYEPMRFGAMAPALISSIVDINIKAPFLFLEALLPRVLNARPIQLALCASVAGYVGLPGGQPYSATKAALISLAESLRSELGDKIDVRLINPGFVESPLTAKNSFSMPCLITAEEAAREIEKGLRGSAFEIHFPKRFTRTVKLLRLVPYRWLFALTAKLSKGARDESSRR